MYCRSIFFGSSFFAILSRKTHAKASIVSKWLRIPKSFWSTTLSQHHFPLKAWKSARTRNRPTSCDYDHSNSLHNLKCIVPKKSLKNNGLSNLHSFFCDFSTMHVACKTIATASFAQSSSVSCTTSSSFSFQCS